MPSGQKRSLEVGDCPPVVILLVDYILYSIITGGGFRPSFVRPPWDASIHSLSAPSRNGVCDVEDQSFLGYRVIREEVISCDLPPTDATSRVADYYRAQGG